MQFDHASSFLKTFQRLLMAYGVTYKLITGVLTRFRISASLTLATSFSTLIISPMPALRRVLPLFLCKLLQLLHLSFRVTPYLYVELVVTLIDLAGHSSNLTS